ncbi:MAG TPA: ATP-binding cassette domain-containing protein [Desulfuromonadales bacterium]|nr:ATP-binding cassette domain-containing protein [Desulfuromonadales bacterium]
MTEAILQLEEASFCYPGNITALDGLSAVFAHNRRSAVLGRNGSGKTTLFSLLNGLQRPRQGRVLFEGEPVRYDRQGLLKLRQAVGMVFQDPNCQLFSASIYEDISFGPLNLGLPEVEVRTRVERALWQMKLEGMEHRPTHSLSFGQKKRACIAGVLAMQPKVLILDEPFAGLDPCMAAEFMVILEELYREGATLIIATHDLDLAYAWADDSVILQDGRLLAQGTAEDVLQLEAVHAELGAEPLIAQFSRLLAESGITGSSGGSPPRSRGDLQKLLQAKKVDVTDVSGRNQ